MASYLPPRCLHNKSQIHPNLFYARKEKLRWCDHCKRLYSVGLEEWPEINCHNKPGTLDEQRQYKGD